jgi:FAD/FMN-containing dehydrogenase
VGTRRAPRKDAEAVGEGQNTTKRNGVVPAFPREAGSPGHGLRATHYRFARGAAATEITRTASPDHVGAVRDPAPPSVAESLVSAGPVVLPADHEVAACWVVAVVVKALGSKLELDAHTPPELDVGVPLARLPEFAARVVDEVARVAPGARAIAFGHLGVAKARWLALTRSPGELQAMVAIKRALDPAGMLKPGAVLA